MTDDNELAARQVARACRKTAFSTLDKSGAPYVSLVTMAFDHDLTPVIIVSAMSAHTRNIMADPRAAMLFDGTDGHPNPQTGPRLSLQGDAVKVEDADEQARLRRRFLARNPGAAEYSTFTDFALWKIVPTKAQFVGGFGRAVWLQPPFGLDPAVIQAFQSGEEALLAHLHAQDRTEVVSVDPDGYDVAEGESWRRVDFAQPVGSVEQAVRLIADKA